MNLERVNKIEAVTERDIDLLFLEELNVSDEFSSWFCKTITNSDKHGKASGAWHSISDASLGESDLVLLFESGLAILIENKIGAITQPAQGSRYRERGARGIEKGLWKEFVTCMIAPELYLQKEPDAEAYECTLSYESVHNWFAEKAGACPRYSYRSYIIKEAIEQNRRGYTVNPDERVTDFWAKYWTLAAKRFPELEMKKPGIKPANSDWPEFHPNNLSKGLGIVHKLERGVVDLQIASAVSRIEKIKALVDDLKLKVEPVGKSVAIRINVEPIDRFSSFEAQKDKAENGLIAAVKLLKVGHEISDRI